MDLTMMERVGDRWEKNGRILFDRPKPTVGCSASGRKKKKMDVREIVVRFPARDRNLSQFQSAQNGFTAYLASYPNDSGSSVTWGKTDGAAS
jgi:hypothetical protein